MHPCESRLDSLTLNMLRLTALVPKPKSYGAECRGLIPIALQLAEELLTDADVMEQTVKQCTRHLAACYDCLAVAAPFAADRLKYNCRRFVTLVITMMEHRPDIFRAKPKLHLFQELCEMELPGRPASHWTYREEEFGGAVAALGRRRGGANTAASIGIQTILKFCARHKLPEV